MKELDMYKKAYTLLFSKLYEVASRWFCDQVAEEINAIFEPPQEFEEVEVVRWVIVAPSGFTEQYYSAEDVAIEARDAHYARYDVAKLTGTIRRPIPQKVERSVSVEATVNSSGQVGRKDQSLNSISGAPHFINTLAECKTGTLTFTWTE